MAPITGRKPGGERAILRRIESAGGLQPSGAHALVGFLEAEAHFAISNNNRSTWACGISTAVRDDDRDVLSEFRRATGLGHLVRAPARAGSRPQAVWTIGSKLECLVMAEILEHHQLRGRRRGEVSIWVEAARLWARARYASDPAVWSKLEQAAARIRVQRRYREESMRVPDLHDEAALRSWFGGFFAGEGCFLLPKRGGARLVIKLRRDDRPLLDGLAAAFAIGSVVNVRTQPPASPAAVWTVCSRPDLLKAIALLDSAPLLGRKHDQYLAWRPGALEVVRAWLEGRYCDERIMEMTRRGLRAAKDYSPPGKLPESTSGADEARSAYVEVLRDWAGATSDVLSCSTYQRFRGRDSGLPNRNTLTRAFGSWPAALEAAGLSDRLPPRSRRRAL